MEDQELKRKIQLLYAVKPREEWVVLTRQRLVGKEMPHKASFSRAAKLALQGGHFWGIVTRIGRSAALTLRKPAVAVSAFVFMAGGMLAVVYGASGSLPGDTLYPLRSTAEQLPVYFSTKEEKPLEQFALVQQRLADLKVVAEQNRVQNLPSAIQEFEENASKVTQGFLRIVENEPERALQASRQMVELQKEKSKVEQILGTKIGEEQEEEVKGAVRKIVEYEIAYLETRSLTEKQELLLESAKEAQAQGNYETALETIWQLSNNDSVSGENIEG